MAESKDASIDQILMMNVLAEREEGIQALDDFGITPDLLTAKGRKAIEFINDYRDENKGQWPGQEAMIFEIGWPRLSLGDLPDMTSRHAARLVLRRTIRDEVVGALSDVENVLKKGQDNILKAGDLLVEKAKRISNIGTGRRRAVSLFSLYPGVLDRYLNNKEGKIDMLTPWPTVTDSLQGWQPASVVWVVGRPSTGKSWALLLNSIVLFEQGKKVMIVSPEMSQEKVADRMACMQVGVSYGQFREGKLDYYGEEKLEKQLTELRACQGVEILSDEMSFRQQDVEGAVRHQDPDVIIVDSAYLFGGSGNRNEQIQQAAPWLKKLSGKTMGRERLVIAAAQMHKRADTAEKTVMDNIYGSDAIAQDGDVIYALFQDESMAQDRLMLVKQLKVREGKPHGKFYSNWDLDTMSFEELRESGYEDVAAELDQDGNPFEQDDVAY
jgi:replicative DNA helicase